ncbi:helix-turn-helix transcriptional regulator [Ningiella sp. W23]|uniref:helix-turn-helix transcriptional regulator n=1 Tax=Ningiella sp. W23 TaxID=3023715 RepID=UPI003757B943
MPNRYQDIYPEPPLLEGGATDKLSALSLLQLEYFEAQPGEMSQQVFAQHHILINLKPEPHKVENWRDNEHREFIFHKDEIVVTPAGIASGWKWHAPSKVIVITLEPFPLEQFAKDSLNIELTEEQLQNIPQFVDHDITQAAIMLKDALSSKIGSQVLFESFARVFLTKLIQSYGLERDEDYAFTRSFTSEHYKTVIDFIADNYGSNILIEDLASQTFLSTYHFARLFKQTIGKSPHQFLMRYRIERAKEKLKQPNPVLFDVALSCGFADQAHFSRVFKQSEGVTPKQYVKSI